MRGTQAPLIKHVKHPELGSGISLSGTVNLCMITTSNASAAALATNITRDISPQTIGLAISTLADVYRYYRIRSIRLRYIPACPTTTAGVIRFAVVFDGAVSSFDTISYLNLSSVPDNFTVAPWQTGVLNIPVAAGFERAYLNSPDTATTAGERQSTQATLFGLWSSNQSAATTVGALEMDYTIDFYGMVPSQSNLPALVTPTYKRILELKQAARLSRDPAVNDIYVARYKQLIPTYLDEVKSLICAPYVGTVSQPYAPSIVDINIKQAEAAVEVKNGDSPLVVDVNSAPMLSVSLDNLRGEEIGSLNPVPISGPVIVDNSIFNPVPTTVVELADMDAVVVSGPRKPTPPAAALSAPTPTLKRR